MNQFIYSLPFLIDIGGAIKDFFQDLLENYVFSVFYYVELVFLYALKLLEQVMMIFTGEAPVVYNGKQDSLINVFFSHDSVRGVYMGIGMVGIVFAFAFAIISVIRKAFDARGKYQSLTMGAILGNLLKSILLIFGMNAIVMVSIDSTNVLLQAISDSFILSKDLAKGGNTITFTDEQYAAMGRILNTIGNYSLNPSYRSRYNLNACYNDIRTDLKYLGDQGVFNYHYESLDENKNEIVTWQSLMEELGTAYDYNMETTLDTYDDGITNAILDAMDIIKQNPNIKVLKSYERKTEEYKGRVSLDRIMFLAGTMGTINTAAARNDAYNKDPDFYDNVRAPFYYGSKNIYSFSDVREVFSVSPLKMNYPIVYVGGFEIAMEMMIVILTCGVRIFNLLALYLLAPLAIATMPMDDGAKFKQWTTAFVIQLLSVLGMVIAIRLFILLLPIIWSPALSVGNAADLTWGTKVDLTSTGSVMDAVNKLLNLIITIILKIVLTYTAVQAISKVNGIFTGILADNAGMQAITAGDMRKEFAESGIGKMMAAHAPVRGMGKSSQEQKPIDKEGGEGSKKGEQPANKAGGAGKSPKAEAQRNKDMKMLGAAIKHGEETGHKMNGKKLSQDGKELAVMKGTLDHMKKDGMSMKDAKAAAEKDYKANQEKKQAENKFHQKELKAGPPNRDKAMKQASKMKDHDYKAMKRDLAFMKENGYHANGKEIKPGERGQMEETLKQYENMHSGGKIGSSGGEGASGSQKNQAEAGNAGGSGSNGSTGGKPSGSGEGGAKGKTPDSQKNQVDSGAQGADSKDGSKDSGGTGASNDTGSVPDSQRDQVSEGGAGGSMDSQSGQGGQEGGDDTGSVPDSQKDQVSEGNAGGSTDSQVSGSGVGSSTNSQRSQVSGSGAGSSTNSQRSQVSGSGAGSSTNSQRSQVSGSGAGSSTSSQRSQVSGSGAGSSTNSQGSQVSGSAPGSQRQQVSSGFPEGGVYDAQSQYRYFESGAVYEGDIGNNVRSADYTNRESIGQTDEDFANYYKSMFAGSGADQQNSQEKGNYAEYQARVNGWTAPNNQGSQVSGSGAESTTNSQSSQVDGNISNSQSNQVVGNVPNSQSRQVGQDQGNGNSNVRS